MGNQCEICGCEIEPEAYNETSCLECQEQQDNEFSSESRSASDNY